MNAAPAAPVADVPAPVSDVSAAMAETQAPEAPPVEQANEGYA